MQVLTESQVVIGGQAADQGRAVCADVAFVGVVVKVAQGGRELVQRIAGRVEKEVVADALGVVLGALRVDGVPVPAVRRPIAVVVDDIAVDFRVAVAAAPEAEAIDRSVVDYASDELDVALPTELHSALGAVHVGVVGLGVARQCGVEILADDDFQPPYTQMSRAGQAAVGGV